MIAAATVTDAPRLSVLHAGAFDVAWPAPEIEALLAGPGVFALSHGGDGFVMARMAADEAEILTLAVAPSARRRGIGRALVKAAAAHAYEMGAISLFLEVAVGNEAARPLYSRLGFAEAGRRKGYYVGRIGVEDALVLRSSLPLVEIGKLAPLE